MYAFPVSTVQLNLEKFKQIKEAYDFLTHNRRVNKIEIDENIDYKELIKMCMKYFSPETQWDSLFVDTSFTGILKDCQKISLKIFEKLNKDKANQVYEFMYQYNYVLGLDDELLKKFKENKNKQNIKLLKIKNLSSLCYFCMFVRNLKFKFSKAFIYA